MKRQMTLTGEGEISSDRSIRFPEGLPGLPEHTQFAVLFDEDSVPFYHLQSLEDAELCFLMVDPFAFFSDYDFELSESVRKQLKIVSIKDIGVYNIVVIGDDFKQSTVNLQAPVIINYRAGLGRQIILNDPDYAVKHQLFSKQATISKER